MPLLAPEQGAPPADTDPIAARAGSDVRAESFALPALDANAARELGDALLARRALFVRWNERAKVLGLRVSLPTRLGFDVPALEHALGGALPASEVADLKRIQERLDRADVKRAYEVLRDGFAESIERHEVQHRLDRMQGLAMPHAIDALVPPGQGPAGEKLRDHIRAELSAYVSQIARDDGTPKTTFTLLLRFLVDPRMRGTPEWYAALVATEELARELAIADVVPIRVGGHLDDVRIDHAHHALSSVPPDALRSAARRVWTSLFAADLPPLSPL
jgi:hypothetical protein